MEAPGERIEHQALICAPERRNQKTLRPVSGDPVDNKLRRQQGHAVNDQIQVFLQSHNGKWMLFVNRCQVGALQYMEKLQLDTLDILCSQIAYSLQHLFTVFAWKSQNDMDNGLQIPCPASVKVERG